MAAPPVLLRPVGFWTTREGDGLPDPRNLQSPTWERPRRHLIASYLRTASILDERALRHACAICGAPVAHRERTDGVWRWPEGLAHYVVEHGVRLPEELLERMERLEFQTADVDVSALRGRSGRTGPEARRARPAPRPRSEAGLRIDDVVADVTDAIPVTATWAVKVQGVPASSPQMVFNRPLVLGREGSCDLVLEHRSVSRRHVRLVPCHDRVIVQDLGSANGVWFRGQQHSGQIEVADGEQLSLGQATITLVRGGGER